MLQELQPLVLLLLWCWQPCRSSGDCCCWSYEQAGGYDVLLLLLLLLHVLIGTVDQPVHHHF